MGLGKRQAIYARPSIARMESARVPSQDSKDRFSELNYYICRKCNVQLSPRATRPFHCTFSIRHPLYLPLESARIGLKIFARSGLLYVRAHTSDTRFIYDGLDSA